MSFNAALNGFASGFKTNSLLKGKGLSDQGNKVVEQPIQPKNKADHVAYMGGGMGIAPEKANLFYLG